MASEREKMLAGELYDPADAELSAARLRARQLCRKLNRSSPVRMKSRRRLLCELFASGGDSVGLEPPFHCDYGTNIQLGQGVYFNFNCIVLDVCLVSIGDRTLLGPAVQIYTATHPLEAEVRRKQEFGRPVRIGNDVWIGGAAIICPGVTIGDRTVIGAGSVVTRDLPSGVLALGNPARVIRPIDPAD
jgi:maltose O-acetyltransferase